MSEEQRVVKIHCPGCGQKMDVSDVLPFARISCPACDAEVIVPRVFAGITLEEPIAEGARATVYRALDPTLDREVVVKALPAGDEQGEAFLAEARRAAAITHANVAPIYSCGVEEGQAYLVMQFLAGRDLGKWLAEAEPGGNPRFALKVGLALGRALSAARRQQLEHGHLVPANVLLDLEGNVKLGDFGLARCVDDDEIWHPTELAYASPEALMGDPELIDWRADLFSVGTIVHQLLTGRDPAAGLAAEQIREARLSGQLPAEPARLVAGLPAGLSDLVMSLLAYRPEDRPSGYEEVVGAFRAFEQKVTHDTASQTRRVKPTGTPARGLKVGALESAGRSRRGAPVSAPRSRVHLLINVGLVVAAIALMILMALLIWQQSPPTPDNERAPAPQQEKAAEANPSPPAEVDPGGAASKPPGNGPASPAAGAVAPLPDVPAGPRPKPAGLGFLGAQPALDAYLQSLPEAARALEQERLTVIRQVRQQLVKDMALPYGDVGEGILLLDGRRLKGSLGMVNESMLQIRAQTGDQTIKWTDLPFPQCVQFLTHYVDQRIAQADAELPKDELAEQRRSIATVCLRNAVLCEWYGQPELGRRFAQLCSENTETLLPVLRRLAPKTLAAN
ncbi:MAG: protein kinase [Victivallales bacterium]|nr:protein kinase [Victivallales bacterium]